MKLCGLIQNSYIHVSVRYSLDRSAYLAAGKIGRPILGIYKLLTDAWMWKLYFQHLSPNVNIELGLRLTGTRNNTWTFAQIRLSFPPPFAQVSLALLAISHWPSVLCIHVSMALYWVCEYPALIITLVVILLCIFVQCLSNCRRKKINDSILFYSTIRSFRVHLSLWFINRSFCTYKSLASFARAFTITYV